MGTRRKNRLCEIATGDFYKKSGQFTKFLRTPFFAEYYR